MENKICNNCKYWDMCRGMLHDGIGCYEPSDKTIIDNTISGMLDKFGEDSQIDVAIEEMSELTKELIKYKRSKIHFRERQASSRDHVVEEISDVLFMIEYLKKIFNISEEDLQAEITTKAKRTKERYLNAKNS
jgi:NTP pyrophosphatase (non-canonical NTP hydrolase)